jgi:hypothetical protein
MALIETVQQLRIRQEALMDLTLRAGVEADHHKSDNTTLRCEIPTD